MRVALRLGKRGQIWQKIVQNCQQRFKFLSQQSGQLLELIIRLGSRRTAKKYVYKYAGLVPAMLQQFPLN